MVALNEGFQDAHKIWGYRQRYDVHQKHRYVVPPPVMAERSPTFNYSGCGRLIRVCAFLAIEVIEFVKTKRSKRTGLPIEIRFSTEDSFRSNLVDLLSIYSAVNDVGVNRVGIADTVGW